MKTKPRVQVVVDDDTLRNWKILVALSGKDQVEYFRDLVSALSDETRVALGKAE